MDPVTLDATIDRPREEVFDYLADVANHAEFCDHYLKDWRLTRVDSSGPGAGARYRVDKRLHRFGWSDMTLIDVHRPWRIVAAATEPKRLWTIDAADHGFSNNLGEFDGRLLEALAWVHERAAH